MKTMNKIITIKEIDKKIKDWEDSWPNPNEEILVGRILIPKLVWELKQAIQELEKCNKGLDIVLEKIEEGY